MTNYEDLTPERKAEIEEAAEKMDLLMDKLDEIVSPDLYREVVGLRADNSELRTTNRSLLEQLDEARARNKEIVSLMMTGRDLVNETADRKDELTAEVTRLTEALAASDADRDRMAQQLALAQSEARGLRVELQRLSAPNGGVA